MQGQISIHQGVNSTTSVISEAVKGSFIRVRSSQSVSSPESTTRPCGYKFVPPWYQTLAITKKVVKWLSVLSCIDKQYCKNGIFKLILLTWFSLHSFQCFEKFSLMECFFVTAVEGWVYSRLWAGIRFWDSFVQRLAKTRLTLLHQSRSCPVQNRHDVLD